MSVPVLVTITATLLWDALSVVSRILLLEFALDPWLFTFIQLTAGGAILLAMGRRKTLPLSSFKRPFTWILGLLRVLSAALYTAMLVWVSVLEAGSMGTITVPLVAAAIWLVQGQRPARLEWPGHLIITTAVLLLVLRLDSPVREEIAILMILNAICVVAMGIIAERHPDNVSSEPGVRLRFTGSVLLITAALFLFTKLFQGGLTQENWNLHMLGAGIAVGVLLRAPSMVFAFWSIKLIGARNYMAAISLLPFAGLAFEQLATAGGWIKEVRFDVESLILSVAVLAGTVLVFLARLRASKKTNDTPTTHPTTTPPHSAQKSS